MARYPLVKMSTPQSQLQTNEAQLIRRVCDGEREVFYELVRPYERMVYATAISILKNPADAEEVAQEAVLKAFSNLPSFRGEAKFSTWLVQITYNEAKMKLRRARAHLYESIDEQQQNDDGDYIPNDFADWRPIPSEALESDEMRKMVQNAINLLAAIYREVLILQGCATLDRERDDDGSGYFGSCREDSTSSSAAAPERQPGAWIRRLLDQGSSVSESSTMVNREGPDDYN